MEFLVRLEDKVNTQVFCLNPAHKGEHMDRVVFDDPTFNISCPECGSNEWLYRKNNAISKKGHLITYKPDNWTWGTNERKHYGIVKINCTEAEAAVMCEGIRNNEKETEARDYEIQANERIQVIIEPLIASMPKPKTKAEIEALKTLIEDAFESDEQYLTLTWNQRQAENRAQIDYRPRKQKYDIDANIPSKTLAIWNDLNKDSTIFVEKSSGILTTEKI